MYVCVHVQRLCVYLYRNYMIIVFSELAVSQHVIWKYLVVV